MSATAPITPARFAEALKDLPLSSLHLKAAELRNSIAHLDYSNEQLKPFALGTEPSLSSAEPDQDCVDAIRENEVVIARMQERIALLKAEVEGRGQSWTEFRTAEEVVSSEGAKEEELVNGVPGAEEGERGEGREESSPWRDGTFQTGRIVNGEVRMDSEGIASAATNGTGVGGNVRGGANGGSLDDEALRIAMEERLRNSGLEDDESEGMHL